MRLAFGMAQKESTVQEHNHSEPLKFISDGIH